ncbi:hypothetical protein HY950_00730 [Candidatus Gottesmanbacteria bacterium]|nr:hypothetical protein [Candidatus Gottesmanbacteria bacterium]
MPTPEGKVDVIVVPSRAKARVIIDGKIVEVDDPIGVAPATLTVFGRSEPYQLPPRTVVDIREIGAQAIFVPQQSKRRSK